MTLSRRSLIGGGAALASAVDGGRGEAWVAVFPEVVAGEYSLLTDDGFEHTPFDVTGAHVTSLDLSVAMLAGRP